MTDVRRRPHSSAMLSVRYSRPMAGEETHEKGADGLRRAKIWLDRTTRAEARWVTPDPIAVPKLTFEWKKPGEYSYSFDLGGVLKGGTVDGQEFLAECKKYDTPLDQGTHYRAYLAKCYCAYQARPDRCDNFMWITWSPFLVSKWDELCTAGYVRQSLLEHSDRALNEPDKAKAALLISDATVDAIADRLWVIVLSKRQEDTLMMSKEHLGLIRKFEAEV